MLGEEAHTSGARLARPTVNIHRTPLGAAISECYSEDPYATRAHRRLLRPAASRAAASARRRSTSPGRRFEFQRMTINSAIGERALREICLLPVRSGGPRRRCLGHHGRLQPLERVLLHREPRAARAHPEGRSGASAASLSSPDWLATHSTSAAARAVSTSRCPGPRSTSARGWWRRCAPARSLRASSTTRRGGSSGWRSGPAPSRLRRRDRSGPGPARASSARAGSRDRGGRAPPQRGRLCCHSIREPERRGDRSERRSGPDHGRRQRQRRSHTTGGRLSPRSATGSGPGSRSSTSQAARSIATSPRLERDLATPEGEPGIALEYFGGHDFQGAPASPRGPRSQPSPLVRSLLRRRRPAPLLLPARAAASSRGRAVRIGSASCFPA